MGSLSFDIDNHANPKDAVLTYLRENLRSGHALLDHSFGPGDGYRDDFSFGGVLYGAVESAEQDDRTVSMHVLAFRVDRDRGLRTLTVKAMHEDMHPFYRAPAQRMMRLLTPTDCREANTWRTEVHSGFAFRRAQRAKARQAVGRTIKFDRPVQFAAPVGAIDTVVVIDAKAWRDPVSGYRLRPVRQWQILPFDIIDQPSTR